MVNGDKFQVKLLANLSDIALVNNIEFVALNAVFTQFRLDQRQGQLRACLLYTSPSPRDRTRSRMPSSA